jgi:hypothetical protein
MEGASMSVLDIAAKYREVLLLNRLSGGAGRYTALQERTSVRRYNSEGATRPAGGNSPSAEVTDERD